MVRAAVLLLTFAVLTSGCLLKPEPDQDRVVEGRPTGDSATNRYYKVILSTDEGRQYVVNFDRNDWYVTGLERELQGKSVDHAAMVGVDRELLNEVIARDVLDPTDWNEYQYDEMAAHAEARGEPFDREALDAEWDARLAALQDAAMDRATRSVEGDPDLNPG